MILQNYFNSLITKIRASNIIKNHRKWWVVVIIPVWMVVCYFAAQALLIGMEWILIKLDCPLLSINKTILNASLSVILYIITLALIIGIPWLVKKRATINKTDMGLQRWMSWTDVILAPAGMVVYLILSSLLILLATKIFPWFDVNQTQQTGFGQLNFRYEYIVAFVTLVVIAPVAEEVIFRGYLFGKLRKFVPFWIAAVVTSVLFGFAHGAWNVAIDVFVLSMVSCFLRESTGNIWTSILIHMLKNGLAFYILFINPLLLTTIGG